MKKGDVISCMVFIGLLTWLLSCKKEVRNRVAPPAADSAHFSITNASPSISNLYFYLNNQRVSLPDSPFSYGKTVFDTYIKYASSYFPDTVRLPYINIYPGFNELTFASPGIDHIISTLDINFEPDSSYSLFLMDTLVHGKVASVLLKDRIIKTDSTQSQIHLYWTYGHFPMEVIPVINYFLIVVIYPTISIHSSGIRSLP